MAHRARDTAAAESQQASSDGGTPWVEGLAIGEVLRRTAVRYADHDAAVFVARGIRWSWQEFDRRVDETARGLLALGIDYGDHVGVWAPNLSEWLLLQFATARIGAVLVTVNPAYRPFELEYVLRQSDAVALFLARQFKTSDYFGMLAEVCPETAQPCAGKLASEKFPRLRHVAGFDEAPPGAILPWAEMLRLGATTSEAELEAAAKRPRAHDPVNIQYTSGTTGFPKAATLSHRNLLLNAYYVGECQRITDTDRICAPVPFYHCFGCVMANLCAAVYGATLIVPGDSFDPVVTLEALERERATALYGVPTMFIAQLEHESFPRRELGSLRTGIMAGSPCPIEIMHRVVNEMGAREVTIAYGLTEASPVITQTRTDDPLELRVETVGRPIPGVEVKVLDAATGLELPDNEHGELCARGHGIMLGYYNDPVATQAAIDAEGWLHTGDLALRQPDGYYRITGRLKDMVIRGGENVYPREIEEYLFTHPAVEQAAVVGLPDPKYGEELCAWIKLRPAAQLDEDEVRRYCRGRLAHFKIPRYVRFVEEFPQTITGKIQKFKIREQMIAELGLSVRETA